MLATPVLEGQRRPHEPAFRQENERAQEPVRTPAFPPGNPLRGRVPGPLPLPISVGIAMQSDQDTLDLFRVYLDQSVGIRC